MIIFIRRITDRRPTEAVAVMMGPGDFIGEGGLAGQPKRMASATAVENLTVLKSDARFGITLNAPARQGRGDRRDMDNLSVILFPTLTINGPANRRTGREII